VLPCAAISLLASPNPCGQPSNLHRLGWYTSDMDDTANATAHDTSRLVATSRDNDFILSLEEVSQRYDAAGHSRTIRTLQRYAASGHLDAQKVATTLGDKYLLTPASVARHIAQIRELQALDTVASSRDRSRRPFQNKTRTQFKRIGSRQATTSLDRRRQRKRKCRAMSNNSKSASKKKTK